MKLNFIPNLIIESELPVWEFVYPDYKNDPTPKTLVLGFYEHGKTGNQLMSGINVRTLDANSAVKLMGILGDIASGRNLKERVRIFRRLARPIFDKAYRTYNVGKMKNVVRNVKVDNIPDTNPNDILDIKPEQPEIKQDDLVKVNGPAEISGPAKINTPVKVNTPDGEKTEAPGKKPKEKPRKPQARPQEVSSKIERSERGLDEVPKRSEEQIRQRSDGTVPGVENPEHRSLRLRSS